MSSLKERLLGLKDIVGIFKSSEKKEKGNSGITYLRAIPLHDLSELEDIESEVNSGRVLILRITPLADENVDDVKRAVKELIQFVESIGGDIARLGEERVVICPPDVKIWRKEKTMSNKPVPTPI
ncbi:MAG: cell division protein SepF [Thermoproteota archaeon]